MFKFAIIEEIPGIIMVTFIFASFSCFLGGQENVENVLGITSFGLLIKHVVANFILYKSNKRWK